MIWMTYLAAVLLTTLFAFAPGYTFMRSLRANRSFALCAAPLVSFAIFGVLAIVFGMRGISCNWLTMVAAPTGVCLVLWLLTSLLPKSQPTITLGEALENPAFSRGPFSHMSGAWFALLLAFLTGLGVTGVVYLGALDSPESFIQTFDNAWHLYRIHTFAKTGVHSSIIGSLYPSVYHSVCALVKSTLGCSNPMAQNAINVVVPALIFPSASVLLLAALFPSEPRKVWLGAVLCLSFAFFPWRIMLFGPLYPNVSAFSLMSIEAAAFILLCSPDQSVTQRLRYLLLFLVGGVGLALTQPNAVFSTGVFLIPFCMYAIWHALATPRDDKPARIGLAIGAELLFVLLVVGVWVYLYTAPFMQSIVHYPQPSPYDLGQAVRWLLDLCFVIRRRQYFLGALVLLGLLMLLFNKTRRWLVGSYLLLGLLYVVGYGVEGELRFVLTGFWYADYYRLAATICVYCVPIAAAGADAIYLAFEKLVSLGSGKKGLPSGSTSPRITVAHVLSTVIVVAIMTLNYYPFDFLPWDYRSYGHHAVNYELHDCFTNGSWCSLGDEEKAFLLKVKDTVSKEGTENALILNQPYDGSVYAGSVLDVPVVYNTYGPYDDPDYVVLRQNLNEVATNPEVQRILKEKGIGYLLQLDQGSGKMGMNERGSFYDHGNFPEDWVGINSVRDNTSGFTVVLSEGDMRLYRIEY